MKVIKHGNTVRELTCPVCGCIFLASLVDVCYTPNYRPIPPSSTTSSTVTTCIKLDSRPEPFFSCPECGAECVEGCDEEIEE